jgi:spermidine synthase
MMRAAQKIAAGASAALSAGILAGAMDPSSAHCSTEAKMEEFASRLAALEKSAGTAAAPAVAPEEVDIHSGFWFEEAQTPEWIHKCKLKEIMFSQQSDFMLVQVIDTIPFGRTLVMDGMSQSAELDEFVYHECLVHPAMLAHPNPKSVYIGGGGEFATAREVMRHKSVEKCVMVDIDKVACDICREQLPEWNGGAYEDPRFEVYYEDAKAWLENTDQKFDVIIMDICDPIEAGPGIALYTSEFYKFAVTKLNPGGIIVSQSGVGSVLNTTECFTVINQTLNTAFKHVVPYTADVPSFGFNWGFNMAFNDDAEIAQKAAAAGLDPASYVQEIPAAELDKTIAARIDQSSSKNGELRFMDGRSYKGVVGVPKPVRKAIAEEKRVITIANPVYMY